MKKTRSKKSRDTVPLSCFLSLRGHLSTLFFRIVQADGKPMFLKFKNVERSVITIVSLPYTLYGTEDANYKINKRENSKVDIDNSAQFLLQAKFLPSVCPLLVQKKLCDLF